jgi:hypothetical protein
LCELNDNDSGVRTVAVKALNAVGAAGTLPSSVRERLIRLAADDPEPHIRSLAREILDRLP